MEDYFNRIKIFGTGSNVKVDYLEKESVLNEVVSDLDKRINNIGDLLNLRYVKSSEKGASSGVASLDKNGKVLLSQLPTSSETFEGFWDCSNGEPPESTKELGHYYRISVDGTINETEYRVGDKIYALKNETGLYWGKLSNNDLVSSVNGQTGSVEINELLKTDTVNSVTNSLGVSVSTSYVKSFKDTTESKIEVSPEKIENISSNSKIVLTPTSLNQSISDGSKVAVEVELDGKKGEIKISTDDLLSIISNAIEIKTNKLKVNDKNVVTSLLGGTADDSGEFSPSEIKLKDPNSNERSGYVGVGYPNEFVAGNIVKNIDDTTNEGIYLAYGGNTTTFDESTGIYLDSDGITIWSPGDNDCYIRVIDEDKPELGNIATLDADGYWDKARRAECDKDGVSLCENYSRFFRAGRIDFSELLKEFYTNFNTKPCFFNAIMKTEKVPTVSFEGSNLEMEDYIAGEWIPLDYNGRGILKIYDFSHNYFFIFKVYEAKVLSKEVYYPTKENIVTGTENSKGELDLTVRTV